MRFKGEKWDLFGDIITAGNCARRRHAAAASMLRPLRRLQWRRQTDVLLQPTGNTEFQMNGDYITANVPSDRTLRLPHGLQSELCVKLLYVLGYFILLKGLSNGQRSVA
jgi:hypothetical protein